LLHSAKIASTRAPSSWAANPHTANIETINMRTGTSTSAKQCSRSGSETCDHLGRLMRVFILLTLLAISLSAQSIRPVNIRCEYRTNPLGIYVRATRPATMR
jgi:hypothetical protein